MVTTSFTDAFKSLSLYLYNFFFQKPFRIAPFVTAYDTVSQTSEILTFNEFESRKLSVTHPPFLMKSQL